MFAGKFHRFLIVDTPSSFGAGDSARITVDWDNLRLFLAFAATKFVISHANNVEGVQLVNPDRPSNVVSFPGCSSSSLSQPVSVHDKVELRSEEIAAGKATSDRLDHFQK